MVELQYHNYLTTPTGKSCILYEITNANYLILNKFAQANDLVNFYKCLNQLIEETIPDFEEFNVIDKLYVYLAYCAYSIHPTVTLSNDGIAGNDIGIFTVLDNIEEAYKYETKEYEIAKNVKVTCSTPRKFVIDNDFISIEYSSAIDSVNGIELKNNEERESFMRKIGIRNSIKLERMIKKDFAVMCAMFKTGIGPFSLYQDEANILDGELFRSLVNVFRERLEDFYKVMYYQVQHMRMSYDSLMRMTPLESRFLFNMFVEEKKKEAEEHEKHNRIHR